MKKRKVRHRMRAPVAIAFAMMVLSCGESDERAHEMATAKASADALTQLIPDLGGGTTISLAADSIAIAARQLHNVSAAQARGDTAVDWPNALERQAKSLRADAERRVAAQAAAGTYTASLRGAIVSLRQNHDPTAYAVGLRALFSWPTVVLLLILLAFFAPEKIRRLLGAVRSIRIFSSEVVLNEQTTYAAEEAFEGLRKQATKRFEHMVAKKSVKERFFDVMNREISPLLQEKLKNDSSLRSTIYVQDILFENRLTQLLDYWPTGGGHGRSFPIYFGIIGKAWRLGRSDIKGNIPTNPENLILDWGMTYDQAVAKGKDRQSFASIILKDAANTVGILYMDCKTKNAFGPDSSGGTQTGFEVEVLRTLKEAGLITKLAELNEEVRSDMSAIALEQ
jgi:hypothetical protein